MTTETPAQRRTRLIEQYAVHYTTSGSDYMDKGLIDSGFAIHLAEQLADAIIAATPQPEPTRYPSEIETRLIELVEHCIGGMPGPEYARETLAAIKRDLGLLLDP